MSKNLERLLTKAFGRCRCLQSLSLESRNRFLSVARKRTVELAPITGLRQGSTVVYYLLARVWNNWKLPKHPGPESYGPIR
jgi:hypothetical protein